MKHGVCSVAWTNNLYRILESIEANSADNHTHRFVIDSTENVLQQRVRSARQTAKGSASIAAEVDRNMARLEKPLTAPDLFIICSVCFQHFPLYISDRELAKCPIPGFYTHHLHTSVEHDDVSATTDSNALIDLGDTSVSLSRLMALHALLPFQILTIYLGHFRKASSSVGNKGHVLRVLIHRHAGCTSRPRRSVHRHVRTCTRTRF